MAVRLAQVGQLLLFLRVSHNNRMLPFVNQLMDLVSGSSGSKAATAPSPAVTLQPGVSESCSCLGSCSRATERLLASLLQL